MSATNIIVQILILSFAVDRLTKAILFLLSLIPKWSRWFPDQSLIADQDHKVRVKKRTLLVYSALIAVLSGTAVLMFPELRVIQALSGPHIPEVIDIVVTVVVVMGGSDLLGRLLQLTGISEASATTTTTSRNEPIEISGRLVLENPDGREVGPRHRDTSSATPQN